MDTTFTVEIESHSARAEDGECNYLVISYKGLELRAEADRAEDNSFTGDYSWIRDALLEAYRLGRCDELELQAGNFQAAVDRVITQARAANL